jgi:hypothetical protein
MKTKMYKPKYNFSPQTKSDRVKSDNSRVKSGSENTSVRRDKKADTNIKDIKIARQCLEFQGRRCYNKDCLNQSCPLHKKYGRSYP